MLKNLNDGDSIFITCPDFYILLGYFTIFYFFLTSPVEVGTIRAEAWVTTKLRRNTVPHSQANYGSPFVNLLKGTPGTPIPELRQQNDLAFFISRIKTGNRIGLIQEKRYTAKYSKLFCTEIATLKVSSQKWACSCADFVIFLFVPP